MTSICNSHQNDKFQAIITKWVREREDHPLNSQNLTIGSRQENIFQESSMVLGMQLVFILCLCKWVARTTC